MVVFAALLLHGGIMYMTMFIQEFGDAILKQMLKSNGKTTRVTDEANKEVAPMSVTNWASTSACWCFRGKRKWHFRELQEAIWLASFAASMFVEYVILNCTKYYIKEFLTNKPRNCFYFQFITYIDKETTVLPSEADLDILEWARRKLYTKYQYISLYRPILKWMQST